MIPVSLPLNFYEDRFGIYEINELFTLWNRTNHENVPKELWFSLKPSLMLLGHYEIKSLLSMNWCSSPTKEFAAKATQEDYYKIGPEFFHKELKAKRGELFGVKIRHIDADNHCELI